MRIKTRKTTGVKFVALIRANPLQLRIKTTGVSAAECFSPANDDDERERASARARAREREREREREAKGSCARDKVTVHAPHGTLLRADLEAREAQERRQD